MSPSSMSANLATLAVLALFLGLVPNKDIPISISYSAPPSAVPVSQTLVSFSIEGDRWPEWANSSLFLNALDNLAQRTGMPPHIRIGADTADHTNFATGLTVVVVPVVIALRRLTMLHRIPKLCFPTKPHQYHTPKLKASS